MTGSEKQAQAGSVFTPSFSSVPTAGGRWSAFGFSYLLQAVLTVLLAKVAISPFMAPVIVPPDTRESVHLVAPQAEQHQPAPEPIAKVQEPPRPRPILMPKVEIPPPREVPPPVELPKQRAEIAKLPQPSIPAPVVKTNTFKSPELLAGPKVTPKPVVSTNFGGSSAPVTVNKPAREVQTGGFGDPNGVPVNNNSTGKGPMIAKLGSFDLPQGPGTGNGTGGAKGVRGTVASAGFGNGTAVQGEGGSGGSSGQGRNRVQSTNFGAVEQSFPDPPKRQTPVVASKDTPVSLLSKPTPTYTLEARQRKIEGDVELDVEFKATGQVHVLRVVQGLGYGLDEAAVRAAEQIHFSPARRDGQPVDSQGRLRIVFRLS